MRKKKNKKKKISKLWGLEKRSLPFYARQLNDQDYINPEFVQSHPEAAKFYSDFIEEFYGNTFRAKEGLHDKKKIARTELYGATNSRARDVYNMHLRINGGLPKADEDENGYISPEEGLIELIDKKREGLVGFDED